MKTLEDYTSEIIHYLSDQLNYEMSVKPLFQYKEEKNHRGLKYGHKHKSRRI